MHCAFDIHVQCLFIIFMKRGAHFIEYFKKNNFASKEIDLFTSFYVPRYHFKL